MGISIPSSTDEGETIETVEDELANTVAGFEDKMVDAHRYQFFVPENVTGNWGLPHGVDMTVVAQKDNRARESFRHGITIKIDLQSRFSQGDDRSFLGTSAYKPESDASDWIWDQKGILVCVNTFDSAVRAEVGSGHTLCEHQGEDHVLHTEHSRVPKLDKSQILELVKFLGDHLR